jgi:acyl-CoA reductase-like NAD-dependent aldehyde dehydrogenase
MGPVITREHRDRVAGYLEIGRQEGAEVALDGRSLAPQGDGFLIGPSVLDRVGPEMRVAREEIFGPVVCLLPYEDEADAIRIANDSEYGLSGSVWAGDAAHGVEVARQVRSGTFSVNSFSLDFNGPFGGFKNSGLGREFGPEGLAGFLEDKTINLPQGYPVPEGE